MYFKLSKVNLIYFNLRFFIFLFTHFINIEMIIPKINQN